jgi:hypothetical protein
MLQVRFQVLENCHHVLFLGSTEIRGQDAVLVVVVELEEPDQVVCVKNMLNIVLNRGEIPLTRLKLSHDRLMLLFGRFFLGLEGIQLGVPVALGLVQLLLDLPGLLVVFGGLAVRRSQTVLGVGQLILQPGTLFLQLGGFFGEGLRLGVQRKYLILIFLNDLDDGHQISFAFDLGR